ncbi:MAG: aminofutalosine synthase MqnE [Deltaproteobacteria bacterium]|nr:aminofutalosine synthase MqnE [Deltaproteobacteria bacterium]
MTNLGNITLKDKQLEQVREKLEAGVRLDANDGICLYESNDILAIGRMADSIRRARHGNKAFFVYNQHVNYTNVCINHCRFCAFSRSAGADGAFTLTPEDVKKRLLERIDEPVTEIHMVGGINPELPFQYYLDLLRAISSVRPNVVIKAFTAVEIEHLSRIAGLPLPDTIERLKEAGLAMVPGGGAEILSRRMHDRLFPKKIDGDRWLDVMEKIHTAGLTSNATMLYGHLETIRERVDHLIQLRELQDRTQGFSAFIPLAFHSANTALSDLPSTTAHDDLKTIAIARLILDNFDHIKAYWVMIGEKLAQVALSFGADDLDGTIIEEKITHMAGAKSARGLTRKQIRRMIESAGFEPVERDSFYRLPDN